MRILVINRRSSLEFQLIDISRIKVQENLLAKGMLRAGSAPAPHNFSAPIMRGWAESFTLMNSSLQEKERWTRGHARPVRKRR
jgi:hypothetical protein